jgi:hypothetical protein
MIKPGYEVYALQWGTVVSVKTRTLFEVAFPNEPETRLVHYNLITNYRKPQNENSST